MKPGRPLACAVALLAGGTSLSAQLLMPSFSDHVELRVYSAKEASRDRFLTYFEEHYLESQEVLGMRIWGQFRDLETPTHFVWIRGYRDMEQRKDGLTRFYTSPMWQETNLEVGKMLAGPAVHVHFLEPVSKKHRFADDLRRPAFLAEAPERSGRVVAQVFEIGDHSYDEVVAILEQYHIPPWQDAGAVSLGLFRTNREPNNFTPLPVLDEEVVVWFFTVSGRGVYDAAVRDLASPIAPMETFVLDPGNRSRMYHRYSAR